MEQKDLSYMKSQLLGRILICLQGENNQHAYELLMFYIENHPIKYLN